MSRICEERWDWGQWVGPVGGVVGGAGGAVFFLLLFEPSFLPVSMCVCLMAAGPVLLAPRGRFSALWALGPTPPG